ncbi:hypothetical protein GCM10023116_15970 [Kistimonas scapharcae]|uniref:Uncharacterized protein n=2 Tax=Kistimonas scapharcae TaxID=1036133 RepID=A0ABP8UZD6_9GAMM
MCGTAGQVYKETGGEYVEPEAIVYVDTETDEKRTVSVNNSSQQVATCTKDCNKSAGHLPLPSHITPIRNPARIIRIWIAPWENKTGDLNAPGLVYSEVEGRTWTISDDYQRNQARLIHKKDQGNTGKQDAKAKQS